MASIYDLTDDFLAIQQLIESGAEGLEDTLESLDLALEDKLEGYASIMKNVESDVNGIDAEIKRLQDRKKVLENGITRMKKAIEFSMLATEKREVSTPKFKFWIQGNKASVYILDESVIPKKYIKTERVSKIDKDAIAELLKAGKKVKGAELRQTESLRMK
ncbi:siphovirus Gp157 family protein [Lysinibacillus sp. FSL L8-0312]|uniref:siphovirus Gp157 family protein n=1 Tax=Lysinibacillus sp. FSL L8-0312 TaxID=2921521 RepID=UPI0030F94334